MQPKFFGVRLVTIYLSVKMKLSDLIPEDSSGPLFAKGLSQGLGLKLRLLSQVSAQKLS